ncbi:S1C family serine protease [Tomitella gaofuii]|uniref:S1C family serine protease n=1 Tax=Tomitella gaofuii TaxID=2760083 RepID=UPI0015FADADD|nr:trypsin-like peptidase domain-containing protein [Tomitella gaofuii]
MSPARGPRRHGTLRMVAAAIITAVVVGGAVGFGLDQWDSVRHSAQAPSATATAPASPTTSAIGDAGAPLGASIALGGPAPALPPDPTVDQVAAAVIPTTVTVWTDIPDDIAGLRTRGAGTGIILTADGVVLTNNHVVSGSRSISVTVPSTGAEFDAEVLGYDRTRDIAILRLTGPDGAAAAGLPAAALGDAGALHLGQPVIALGNAGGTGSLVTSPGTVTAFDQSIRATDSDGTTENLDGVIQIAADINPGDSGGPLVDMTGRVVGINTAKSESAQAAAAGGRGYAVPIGDALGVARVVLGAAAAGPGGAAQHGTVHVGPTAQLGVRVRSRTAEPPRGAVVVEIVPGSAASSTPLRAGDVVTALDGKRIAGADDLSSAIDRHRPGDVVELEWVDAAGAVRQAPVTLDEGLPG